MLAKPLLLALLAACGVPSSADVSESPTAQPDGLPPAPPEEDGQHFCCESLGGNGSGNGCVMIGKEHVALCDKILYCGGTYEKDGGKVKCIGD
jgi:hypothetical protein